MCPGRRECRIIIGSGCETKFVLHFLKNNCDHFHLFFNRTGSIKYQSFLIFIRLWSWRTSPTILFFLSLSLPSDPRRSTFKFFKWNCGRVAKTFLPEFAKHSCIEEINSYSSAVLFFIRDHPRLQILMTLPQQLHWHRTRERRACP